MNIAITSEAVILVEFLIFEILLQIKCYEVVVSVKYVRIIQIIIFYLTPAFIVVDGSLLLSAIYMLCCTFLRGSN